MRTIILISIILLTAGPAHAALYTADSCSRSDVQSKINSASDGDTIIIPAGQCTWTSKLAIPSTLSVTLMGAGMDTTYIGIDSGNTFSVQPNVGEFVRISNMELDCGISIDPGSGGSGTEVLNGFRVDHIKIDQVTRGSTSCEVYGALGKTNARTYGVFDHITMETNRHMGIIGGFPMQNSDGGGMEVWYEDAEWGTASFIYLEDSVINNYGAPIDQNGSFDGRYGNKLAIRHSTFLNHNWGWHGNHTTNCTAARAQEIYETDWVVDSSGQIKWNQGHRGGNFIVWNNTFATNQRNGTGFMVEYRREQSAVGEWGTCDTSAELFCVYPNDPIGESQPRGSAPSDSGDCDPGGIAVQVDSQAETTGYMCRNQTGSGKTNRTTGVQYPEPSYYWDNLHCVAPDGNCTPDRPLVLEIWAAPAIKAGRDVFDYQPSSSVYDPYDYPHPLTGEQCDLYCEGGVTEVSPSPPSGLTIVVLPAG